MVRKVALLLLVAACSVPVDGAGGPRASGSSSVPVVTTTVRATEAPVSFEAFGALVADAAVSVRAEVAGVVSEVGFRDGDGVRAGAVLVRLRDAEARAAEAEAEAELALARADLARAEALFAKAHIAAAEVDAARARRDLAAARALRAEESLRRTVVRAPFDGVVGVRAVERGDVLDPSREITTLTRLDPILADLDLPERLAAWVGRGQAATVRVEAWGDEVFEGEVSYVAPSLDAATGTLRVRVSLPNGDARLRPGMTVRASIVLAPPRPVVAVPAVAVTTRADGPMVWVVADGVARARPVRTGERQESTVVVTEGLADGEEIVVEGVVRLRDGIAVTARPTVAAAAGARPVTP